MNTINALTFRHKFGEILDRVAKSGYPLVIERQNQPIAVLYPYKDKKNELEAEERKKRLQKAEKMLTDWREKWGSSDTRDSTQIIRRMRDNRYGKRWWKTGTNY